MGGAKLVAVLLLLGVSVVAGERLVRWAVRQVGEVW